MNRLLGPIIILLWGCALFALIQRDVLPYWRAEQRPPDLLGQEDIQVGLFATGDRRIGTSWVTSRKSGVLTLVQSQTQLSTGSLPIPGAPRLPAVFFDTTLTFRGDGSLTDFETQLYGLPMLIRAEGHLLGIDYSCMARFGQTVHKFSLDARRSRQLGEALRPFTHLPNLEVGQSWQLQLLDPSSLITGSTVDFRPLLVQVKSKGTIPHPVSGKQTECFFLESDRAFAWADETGRVLVQVVDLPLIGKITLRDEIFDEAARRDASRAAKMHPVDEVLDHSQNGHSPG